MKKKLLLLFVLLTAMTVRALAVDVDSIRYSLNSDGTATVTNCLYTSTPNIVIPSTITSGGNTYTVKAIGSWVFNGFPFITSITLPSTLESIAYRAFYYSRIKTLTLPEGLVTIGQEAFSNCDSLKSITLPASIQTIDNSKTICYNTLNLVNLSYRAYYNRKFRQCQVVGRGEFLLLL